MKNSVKSNGRIHYICRKCNTEKARLYRQTTSGMAKVRNAVYKSILKYPEKQKARMKVQYAVKTGVLSKPKNCEVCFKKKKVSAHHEDYKSPLLVLWLCGDCHNLIHKL